MTARTDSVDATGWEYEAATTDKGIIHIVSGGIVRDQSDVTFLAHRLGAAGLSGARWKCSIIRPRGGGLTFRYVYGSGPGFLPPCSIVANGYAGTGEPEKGFYRTVPIKRHGMTIGDMIVDDDGDGFTLDSAVMTIGERLDRAARHWRHIVTNRPWTFADRIIIKRRVADPVPTGSALLVSASTALILVRASRYARRFNDRRYVSIDGNARADVVNEIARMMPLSTAMAMNDAVGDINDDDAGELLERIRSLEQDRS